MEETLAAGCVEALRAGDFAEWRTSSLILADWYEESGQDSRAIHRRRKAATRRTPGCLWPRAGLVGLERKEHGLVSHLSDHQREQLRYALRGPVGLLTGTPGTGKTYTTAWVIKQLVQDYGRSSVALCAPTGKAAVRLTQALRQYNVPSVASTIHSLLEIGRNGHDGEGWGFQRNERNHLAESVVVVDEASMLDVDLFASLLSACATGTHLLLVGDPYQLPPVGHGAPLRDMIAAGLPRGHLSEIRRNAGMIVEACSRIKDGKRFEVCDRFDPEWGKNLRHVEKREPEEQVQCLQEILHAFAKSKRFDPLWDVQIIIATNTAGPLSRREVNRQLQTLFNPGGYSAAPNPFRKGDKIICLKNQWCPGLGNDSGQEYYVANGEIGQVVGVEPRLTGARFDEPTRHIRIPMGKPRDDEDEEGGTGCDFDLGYAITAHKSQGSSWPCVIILADASPFARRTCTREWLYTAISRAEKLCITIGRLGVLYQMVARVSLEKRKTFLEQMLRGNS